MVSLQYSLIQKKLHNHFVQLKQYLLPLFDMERQNTEFLHSNICNAQWVHTPLGEVSSPFAHHLNTPSLKVDCYER